MHCRRRGVRSLRRALRLALRLSAPDHEHSITELEYRAACCAGLKRLIFFANAHERWPKDEGEGADKLAALRQRLGTDHVVAFFDQPHELAGKVAAAMANLRNEQIRVEIEELRERRDDRDRELASTEAARPSVNAPPVTIDQLFDRTQHRRDLRGYLDDARVRWIGVVGRGGIGKTALAAWVLQDRGLRGILWLSSRTTGLGLERLTADVGRLLGEPTGSQLAEVWQRRDSTLAEKIDALIASFPSAEYAVVLDGLEEELAEDGAVAEQGLRAFVEACLSRPDGPRIVATSREDPLIPFNALDVARTIRLDQGLDSEGAVMLLQSLDPQGELGLREAPIEDLRRAAERTRGIPRALEILAGLLQSDPAASLSTLLTDDRLEAMTVESIVAEGYRRLDEDERLVMQALAALNRPADETAVAFVLQPWFPGLPAGPCLRRLVRSHFVKADRATGEFSLQLSDREHAYGMIPESASKTASGNAAAEPLTRIALELRAADFYAGLRKPADQWLTIHDVSPQLAEIEHCLNAGAYERAAEVLDLIESEHLYLWGHYTLIIDLRTQLRGRGLPAALEASNCGGLAVACQVLGRFEESIAFYDEAVAAARTSGDRALLGHWVGHRGRLYRNQGRLEGALASFQEALEIAVELGEREQEGFWRDRTGLALRGLGKLQEAVEAHRQALSIAVELNRRRDEGAALSNLGWVLRLQGETDEARDCLSRAFAIAEEIDDLRGHDGLHGPDLRRGICGRAGLLRGVGRGRRTRRQGLRACAGRYSDRELPLHQGSDARRPEEPALASSRSDERRSHAPLVFGRSTRGGGRIPGEDSRGLAVLVGSDRARRLDLLQQVVVPLPFHLDVRGGALQNGVDQVVIQVDVQPGLQERVERRAGGTAGDEPRLQARLRRIAERPGLPHVVPVPADEVRTRVAIGLGVDEQHRLAHLGRQGAVARQGSHRAVEDHVAGLVGLHHLERVLHGRPRGHRRTCTCRRTLLLGT